MEANSVSSFVLRLPGLYIMFIKFIHVFCAIVISLFLTMNSFPLCKHTMYGPFIPLVDIWEFPDLGGIGIVLP